MSFSIYNPKFLQLNPPFISFSNKNTPPFQCNEFTLGSIYVDTNGTMNICRYLTYGVNSVVRTITNKDSSGNIYVGGNFTLAGNKFVGNITKWNGSTFDIVGPSNFPGVSSQINTMVFDSNGNLYIGGGFSATNSGTTLNRITWWNPSNPTVWNPLGGSGATAGLNGNVNTMVFDSNGNLYIGGSFTASSSGTTLNRITWWNPSNPTVWNPLGGSGATAGFKGTVNTMVFDSNGKLYIGGDFSATSSGILCNGIVRYDPSTNSWDALGNKLSPSTTTSTVVNSLVIYNNNILFVGGLISSVNGVSSIGVCKYDISTSTWYPINIFPTGITVTIQVLKVIDDYLYIGGSFTQTLTQINTQYLIKYDIINDTYEAVNDIVDGTYSWTQNFF